MPASASSTAGGLVGSTSMTGSAVHHHHHHLPHHLHPLHRQSSSPAPNESNIETEEEDLAHKVGSESEEEAPFAFRRKQGCDYLRVKLYPSFSLFPACLLFFKKIYTYFRRGLVRAIGLGSPKKRTDMAIISIVLHSRP